MKKKYKIVNVEYGVHELIDLAQEEYRSHHPELDCMYLSKSKILYEVLKYYLPDKTFIKWVKDKELLK